jgi:hypothetical protein
MALALTWRCLLDPNSIPHTSSLNIFFQMATKTALAAEKQQKDCV